MKILFFTLLWLVTISSVLASIQKFPSINGDDQLFKLGEILRAQDKINATGSMSVDSLEQKVKNVLKIYYKKSLGGENNWEGLQSMIAKGKISIGEDKTFDFISYRKKPDLHKSVLKLDNGLSITKSFDGNEAWQHKSFETEKPISMPKPMAMDFVRDSVFASHLLYPELANKQIKYLGEERVGKSICYRLEITLPNTQSLIVSIDAETGLQISQEFVRTIDKKLIQIIQSDFKKIAGTMVPFSIKIYNGVELMNHITISSVEANKGLMPWTFKR